MQVLLSPWLDEQIWLYVRYHASKGDLKLCVLVDC